MVTVHGADWIDAKGFDLLFDAQVYVNMIPETFEGSGARILFAFSEPEAFRCSNKSIIENSSKFDLIITYSEEVLNACSNARLFTFGNCWVRDFKDYPKNLSVSFLVGGKAVTEGHLIRHAIWNLRNHIKVNKIFYVSKHLPIPGVEPVYPFESKLELFEGVPFHICIENVKENNFFTEKVIDCFATMTVPIYWGCPNIGKYFNTDGMIIGDTVEQIIELVNEVTMEKYESMLPAIRDNFERQKEYNQNYKSSGARLNSLIRKAIR